jgi:hypothetical protein
MERSAMKDCSGTRDGGAASRNAKKKARTNVQALRAEDEARTRDNQLGRLELYQLSYFRITVQI